MRYLIATARSGSTSLQKYLSKLMPLEGVRKILIHRVPDMYQNDTAKRYLNQYYKMYGMKNKWILDTYMKNKWK